MNENDFVWTQFSTHSTVTCSSQSLTLWNPLEIPKRYNFVPIYHLEHHIPRNGLVPVLFILLCLEISYLLDYFVILAQF